MIVVLPYSAADYRLARKLAQWVADIGPYPGHRAYVIKDSRVDDHEVARILRTCFDSVQEVNYPDDGRNTWPFSANRMWNLAAKEIEYSARPEPWLWLEPDAVPQGKGWLTDAKAGLWPEYQQCGKPFMGDEVNVNDVPLHMSGVAIYPARITQWAWEAVLAQDTAWDVFGAAQIVPKAHWTNRICHNWRHEPIDSVDKLANLRGQHPEMVLFHSDKSGRMIDILREDLSGSVEMRHTSEQVTPEGERSATSHQQVVSGSGVPSAQICFDIFIKTYPPDYPWLAYCLRSIDKFASGFRKVVIVHPEGQPIWDSPSRFHVVAVGEQPDGYLWQQVIKLDADKYTNADYICYLDSDTIFIRPVTPELFSKDGKIVWMVTPYDKVQTPWQAMTEKFMKRPVAFEFMRRHPMVIPRWLLREVRAFCEREHGMPLDKYILNQPHREFSEFNAIGAFAYEFFRDEFYWVNTEETPPEEWPTLTVLQSWSRGGLTEEKKKEYERILGGGPDAADREDAPDEILAGPSLNSLSLLATSNSGLPPSSTISDRIRMHCDALIEIADGQVGRYKMILNELRKKQLAPKGRKNKRHRQ